MKRMLKIGAMLLCIILLTALLPACAKENDPFTITGFPSLTIEKNNTLRAVVNLSIADVEAHAGEKVYVYEVLPGEDWIVYNKSEPVGEAEIGSEMVFEIPLYDGEHTRLYSSFVVCYENGKPLMEQARAIDNPGQLASCNVVFDGAMSPKGLSVSDVDTAAMLGTTHAMLNVSISALCSGWGESYRFDGEEYTYSSSSLKTLDNQVRDAYAAGMQTSLRMNFDSIGTKTALAVLDFLATRYSNEDFGVVTAFFVEASSTRVASSVAVFANTALASNVKNGRVYVVCNATDIDQAEAFYATVANRISSLGDFSWGAAISLSDLDSTYLPWEQSEKGGVDLHSLSNLVERVTDLKGGPSYLAVCDLNFDATDENLQATSLAYAYAKAIEAKVGLVYYDSQMGDCGLFDSKGRARASAEIFQHIDIGLGAAQTYLCKSVSDTAWNTISLLKPTRTHLSGNGGTGYGVGKQEMLFDFSDGKTFDFISIGGVGAPQIRDSDAWKKPVLYTWLNPQEGLNGIRALMEDGQALSNASAITFRFLAQYKEIAAESCKLTLCLMGADVNGATVTYEADASFRAKKWQTLTFDVSDFTARADLSRPCSISVLCEPSVECNENFVLFFKDISAFYPQDNGGIFLPVILLTLAGILIGFLLIFIMYRRVRIFRRRRA